MQVSRDRLSTLEAGAQHHSDELQAAKLATKQKQAEFEDLQQTHRDKVASLRDEVANLHREAQDAQHRAEVLTAQVQGCDAKAEASSAAHVRELASRDAQVRSVQPLDELPRMLARHAMTCSCS